MNVQNPEKFIHSLLALLIDHQVEVRGVSSTSMIDASGVDVVLCWDPFAKPHMKHYGVFAIFRMDPNKNLHRVDPDKVTEKLVGLHKSNDPKFDAKRAILRLYDCCRT